MPGPVGLSQCLREPVDLVSAVVGLGSVPKAHMVELTMLNSNFRRFGALFLPLSVPGIHIVCICVCMHTNKTTIAVCFF